MSTEEMTTKTEDDLQTRIASGLDRIEEKLPSVPAAAFRLQRAVGERVASTMCAASKAVQRSASAMADAASTATKTVTGTARWASERTVDTATVGAKTVAGQAKAQSSIAGGTIADEATDLATSAKDAMAEALDTAHEALSAAENSVSAEDPTGGYETWTKSELYDRAQELDIAGRSTMNKRELIRALRS